MAASLIKAGPDASNLDQSFPEDARAFTPYLYGLTTFKSLYTPRQLIALSTFAELATEARELVLSRAQQNWFGAGARDDRALSVGGGGPVAYADAVATYLAFAVDKAAVQEIPRLFAHGICVKDKGSNGSEYGTSFHAPSDTDGVGLCGRQIRYLDIAGGDILSTAIMRVA